MPICVRCGNIQEKRSDFLNWIIITKQGTRLVTEEEVTMGGSFFDYPSNLIWEDHHMIGLCPKCQKYLKYEVTLSRNVVTPVWARSTDDMLKIVKKQFPEYEYSGHKLVSDNTS